MMKKGLWIILTLILSGLIPAGVTIMIRYNDLCSAAKKAYHQKDYIESIKLSAQASKLVPFMPQRDREIQRCLSELTKNPARILHNLFKEDEWPEIASFMVSLHARLAPFVADETLALAESITAKGIRKETRSQTLAAIASKQLDESIFGLAILLQLKEDIVELMPNFIQMAQQQGELPNKTFQNICRLQTVLPLEESSSAQWQSFMDRLYRQYASNTATSVATKIKDINVEPLRCLQEDLPKELAIYCSPEQVKIVYDDVLDQIKEIAEPKALAAYDAQDLNALAVEISILANVGYGETASEKEALNRWLKSYATWLKQEKYLATHNLIDSLKSNVPTSFHKTTAGELIDKILSICEKQRGIKYSGEIAIAKAFEKGGFIVFPAASEKPVATFRLTAPQVKHGMAYSYSSGGYGASRATRYNSTATMSGIVLNADGQQIKRITVSNAEPAPTSISYYSSSSSSIIDSYGSPTQETIDSNAKKGLMQKMEAEIIRQAPYIRL